ncbi:hypothetical protein [Arthrobacter woluwensis]|uniref:Uncharacterized protein n=1 Tax=Arthrobacter woluwensis TaxID=156980 RepID=A0A1H4I5U5_9MICC|nr:hypothetical protein [Arthrobacter woluwensis]SEB29474.1 hypothetical protein SAMN04489745_0053 [Arthrobacter woluwensis]SEB30261.1 hypothetical protein SAMN04489745_0126 [Arthrobacter woluwensis]
MTEATSIELARLRQTGYLYQSTDYVEAFSVPALRLAERLWEDVTGFHNGPYFLPESSPLPGWFLAAVRGFPIRGVEAGWPQFARYWDPINWPALVSEHPEGLVWGKPEHAAMYTQLWDWGTREGLAPWLDVFLFVSADARIEVAVSSFGLTTNQQLTDARIAREVEAIFTAHGFADAWRFDDSQPQWELD